MLEKSFFEIPIYRCSFEQHLIEMEKEKTKYIRSCLVHTGDLPEIRASAHKIAENHFDRHRWRSWFYNEVIAWIRLYQDHTQIKGELWLVGAKKIRRGLVRKKFYFDTWKIIELNLEYSDSSEKIFDRICNELTRLAQHKRFKKWYMDLGILETIGPFVDWRQLFSFERIDKP